MGEWNESDHPRDTDGKFGSGGGSSLSTEEDYAVSHYVTPSDSETGFLKLNKALRNSSRLTSDQQKQVTRLDSALKKLPKFSGRTYRSVHVGPSDAQSFLDNYIEGKTVTFADYLSTSKNTVRVQNSQIAFVIEGSTGADLEGISKDTPEQEVLYPRDSRFKITRIAKGNNGKTIIGMREVNSASDFALDATMRTFDKDGRLHIARSHISKACVNPYYGREIPRSQALGLEPDRIYMMLRHPEELAKAAPTFARLPILAKHTPISNFDSLDEKEKKKYIVGTIGSDVEFLEPFLDADVSIWDADAIAGIETEQQCEFSCGYSYEPIMTTGNYAGENYDGIMTQIQGNHLALVESGRAGPEVRAADSKLLEKTPMKRSKLGNALIVALSTAFPKVQIAADSELEKVLAPATRKDFGTAQREAASKLILAMDSGIDQKQVFAVMDALSDVDDPEPKKNDEPEPAKDKRRGKDAKPECDCEMPNGKHSADCKMGKDAAAEEEAERKRNEDAKAMDAKLEQLRADFRDADQAKRDVRPVVGDVVAMDSAEKIYEFALDQMKVDHTGVQGTAALRALFNVAKDRSAGTVPAVVMDSAAAVKRFANAGRFRQA